MAPAELEEPEVDDPPVNQEEILDAEILDAEMIDEEPPKVIKKTEPKVSNKRVSDGPATLLDIVRKPQVAAVLLTLVILGAGGYYYLDNQLDSFTADQLRYGDAECSTKSVETNDGLASFPGYGRVSWNL